MVEIESIYSKFDNLFPVFGVKEEINTIDLLDYIIDRDYQKAATLIARKLDLPINVYINVIHKKEEEFREGKVAEVSIPANLPFYGSNDLNGFPINIRLIKLEDSNPDVFVNIICHELSHILLASIKSPFYKDEKMVDLCPILLGFKDVLKRSRATIFNSNLKTSYGYLNDDEFNFAYNKTNSLIEYFRKKKSKNTYQISKLSKNINLCKKILHKQELVLKQFDKKTNRKIKNEHFQDIVEFHDLNYFNNQYLSLDKVSKKIMLQNNDLSKITHYGEKTEKLLVEFQEILDKTEFDIKNRISKYRSNKLFIFKYLTIFEKINYFLKKIISWL